MKTNDGGPAFPCTAVAKDFEMVYEGMTLRDYFAAKAMTGMLANSRIDEHGDMSKLAAHVYKLADAMMKVREIS